VGEEIDRDRLIHFLYEGGYTSTKIVEERGDFSVRGAIIDLSTPFYEEPLRLEFDGDRLESIRRFEAETQRSLPQGIMNQAILLPARDISRDTAAQPLKTLFDYLKGNEIVFVEEGDEVEKEVEAFSRLIEQHYEKALFKKKAVSPPETTYLRNEEVSIYLERFRKVYLQGGPLAPSMSQQVFSFEMETHENFQREMKTVLTAKPGFPETSPFSILLKHLHHWQANGMGIFVVSHTEGQADRLSELFSEYGVAPRLEKAMRFREAFDLSEKGLVLLVGSLSSGFRNPGEGWMILTEEEIFEDSEFQGLCFMAERKPDPLCIP
jgi:transcription-repair coupling factor (superfamily II helicase)